MGGPWESQQSVRWAELSAGSSSGAFGTRGLPTSVEDESKVKPPNDSYFLKQKTWV